MTVLYQVDAFTDEVFGGNPAAVCPMQEWLPDETLQHIAAENNLSETAFFVPQGEGFQLRWFTPIAEINLCGHATLASAFVLFEVLDYRNDVARFFTQSGELRVTRQGSAFQLDFPAQWPGPAERDDRMTAVLGKEPLAVHKAHHWLAVYASVKDILALEPDFETMKKLDAFSVIATAPGEDCGFVSRTFVPKMGIPEDPVTGASHCLLTPYWTERLDEAKILARQLSKRGGELVCELKDDRVLITGKAVLYMKAEITTSRL